MSEDTPECAKLLHLKNSFRGNICHLTLINVFQDQGTSNYLKNDAPMTCMNMN